MAYRQYIGARYVPLYVGNWDSTRNYEPLSIVTDGNGNSYTSLRDIPAGTALTDRTYWVQTSSFSGAVDQLRRDMNQAQNDISTLQSSETGILDRVQVNETNITSLQTFDDKINVFKNKRVLIIGDSIGDPNLSQFQPNYVTHLQTMIESCGGTVTNDSKGGRAFSASAEFNLDQALTQISGAYDIILLYLGINDFHLQTDIDSVKSAFTRFQAWLTANQPDADVYFVTPFSYNKTVDMTPLLFYRAIFLWMCSQYAYKVIDLYMLSPRYVGAIAADRARYTYNGDGIHPIPAYAPILAKFIFDGIMNGGTQIKNLAKQGQNYITRGQTDSIMIGASAVGMYTDGMGNIHLLSTRTNVTPSQVLTNIGQLPDWCRPYNSGVVWESFNGVIFFIRWDGTIYMQVPEAGRTYTDVSLNVQYQSKHLTVVNR